jgi:large subunit ribosomal protein L25
MTKINLESEKRDVIGKGVKKLRKEGLIPAILYGNKLAPQSISVNRRDFERVYGEAGESTIIDLEIGKKNKVNVLIHDVQRDPLSGNFSHVDFFQIRMDQKIETGVPIEIIGEAPAVKELGGVLVKNVDDIPVRCLPADLPPKFVVDVSKLKTFEDHFVVKDLNISEKIKVLVEPETIVALVAPPRSEEELASLEEKVEEDVSKVEGMEEKVPEEVAEEGEEGKEEKEGKEEEIKTGEKTEEKSEKKE